MFIELIILIIIMVVISSLFPENIKFQVQLVVLGLLFMGRYAYSKNKLEGVVTETGIKRDNGEKEILFSEIRSVFGTNTTLEILTRDGLLEKIFLPDEEFVKLTKKKINNIIINKNSVIMTPREFEQGMFLTYLPVGKYRFELSWEFFLLVGIISALVGVFGIAWVVLTFFMGIALQSFLEKYKQIFIEICNMGITVKNKDDLQFIPFQNVISIEKKFFTIKLKTTTKTLFLPRGCCFLYTVLAEYTNNSRRETVNTVVEGN